MFCLPQTPPTPRQLIYFPFLILLFIYNFPPQFFIPSFTILLFSLLILEFLPSPQFYYFPSSSSSTSSSFLLFSIHHHHHHISIVFPPPPPIKAYYDLFAKVRAGAKKKELGWKHLLRRLGLGAMLKFG